MSISVSLVTRVDVRNSKSRRFFYVYISRWHAKLSNLNASMYIILYICTIGNAGRGICMLHALKVKKNYVICSYGK